MTWRNGFLALCCAVVAQSGCSSTAASSASVGGQDTAEARRGIATAWQNYIDAVQKKDTLRVADIYAEDAVYIVPGLLEIRGRPALEEMEANSLGAADVIEASHRSHSLHCVRDVAYEIGTVTGQVRAAEGPVRSETFHYVAMWRRQDDGVWRIWHLAGQP